MFDTMKFSGVMPWQNVMQQSNYGFSRFVGLEELIAGSTEEAARSEVHLFRAAASYSRRQ